jgi:hypothetical protein
MRVHGDVEIRRRGAADKEKNYKRYIGTLSEDFGHICGYCGKSEMVTTKGFEIDHFVPRNFAPDRINDYTNLVYACVTCNRTKSSKWPTEDKNVMNDGKVGFIDPASEEYDLHLYRNEEGGIEGLTEVGQYMCEKALNFRLRPMREVWLYSEILSRQEMLEKKISSMSPEDVTEYIELNKRIKELHRLLFSKKE